MAVRDVVQAAAGVGGDKLYVEDVFSTYLYTGNGSTQTITNGIDLAGEGGLVWIKSRSGATYHDWFDTARGVGNYLFSNTTDANVNSPGYDLTAFNSNGFSLGPNGFGGNANGASVASWTFRKAPKFFDVVTYTGDGTNPRNITHSLASIPGSIIIKRTDSSSFGDWIVWHRDLSANTRLRLNLDAEVQGSSNSIIGANNTDSTFQVGDNGSVNLSGGTYVAYLFAHNAGGFGADGTEDVISCGSYTEGSGNVEVDVGFESQFVLMKSSSVSGYWYLYDNMRGITTGGNDARLFPNDSLAENSGSDLLDLTSTGFIHKPAYGSGATIIYIAIRRPMKTPTAGTEVFDVVTSTQALNASTPAPSSITDDFLLSSGRTSGTVRWDVGDRMRGGPLLFAGTNDAEVVADFYKWDTQTGTNFGDNLKTSADLILYHLRRAPGFMDVVAYTGTGSATTVAHNLGVAPELMIVRPRTLAYQWSVWHKDIASTSPYYEIVLNTSEAQYDSNNTNAPFAGVPTSTGIPLPSGTASASNRLNYTYIAYLFATLSGVSKVGSYTGTTSDINVDCGFSAGARFVLIKRTDSTGDWYVWDSARGIVAGNDPYLLLNSTAAEVTSTDYIDPLAAGFTVTSSAPAALNASGGTYIFLAIA